MSGAVASELVELGDACAYGHAPGGLLRVAEYARRYEREGDRCAPVLDGEVDGLGVAAREQLLLAVIAAVPSGSHRMDDVARRQREPWRDDCISRVAMADLVACRLQLGVPGGIEDRAAHAASGPVVLPRASCRGF